MLHLSPQFMSQPTLRQEPTSVEDEHLQQVVLRRCDLDFLLADLNRPAVQINDKIACLKDGT